MNERFEKKFIKRGPQECWLWTAAHTGRGYGNFSIGHSRLQGAHRVAYELYVGPIPKGLCVLHRCDVPACVNPAHLFLGTPANNARDRTDKGRSQRGEAHGRVKLTEADVLAIRADARFQKDIAKTYMVHRSAISHIKLRRNWNHI